MYKLANQLAIHSSVDSGQRDMRFLGQRLTAITLSRVPTFLSQQRCKKSQETNIKMHTKQVLLWERKHKFREPQYFIVGICPRGSHCLYCFGHKQIFPYAPGKVPSLSSNAVCSTNILEKITQKKGHQCHCSQNMQKCKSLMEDCLQQTFHHLGLSSSFSHQAHICLDF